MWKECGCYDLAGVRPVTTEISFEALEKMSFPHDMEGSENLSLHFGIYIDHISFFIGG